MGRRDEEVKGIWITWERQRRNIGISSGLGWPLHEIVINKGRILRYLLSVIETVTLYLKDRPEVVAVKNPSIVLATITILLRFVFRYTVLIDAHNSGIYPGEGRSVWLGSIARWLQRKADLTIVTNQNLKKVVEMNGGRAFVLPDRLPFVEKKNTIILEGKVNIAFICTYNMDEPYKEVIKAAGLIPEDVMIYMTGRFGGKVDPSSVPTNVKLLGFVPDDKFWELLSSSNIIMDLTLREGCLVCGAYEGVALLKPLILSDTKALRSYFSDGCIYVKPDAESIARGIDAAIKNISELRSGIKFLKDRLEISWERSLKDLRNTIETMS